MSPHQTFGRLRPPDEPLDEMTSDRIWRAITSSIPQAEVASIGAVAEPPVEDEWIDLFADEHRGRRSTRRRVSTVAAAAVVLAGLGGLAALQASRTNGTTASLAAASPGADPSMALPNSVVPDTSVPTTPVPTTTLPNQLPDGGMWIGGQLPSCTALDSDTYECTLPEPYDASMPDATGYEIGMQMWFLDNSSLVAGGCRITTTDARNWRCYVGSRAVDEGYLHESTLGSWQPNEFSAG